MKRYLFFDLDGTLTDPGVGITNSVMVALKSYGIVETDREKLYPFIGPPLVDSFQRYYGFSKERAFEATLRFQEYFSKTGMFENRVYSGIPELLEKLSASGFVLVLATSKPEPFAKQIMDHFSLSSYFSFLCGSTMDEKTRMEKSQVLSYAIEQSAAKPGTSVMIGDRKFDVLAGKWAGMKTVGVLYGYGSEQELSDAGADVICHRVSDLEPALLSFFK